MRILITGSRNHDHQEIIHEAIEKHAKHAPSAVTIVSGGCPTGADRIAEEYARIRGFSLEIHPADWREYGRAAGPIRNQEMVDAGADIVLAFPFGESRGTRHCISAAQKEGLEIEIYEL